MQTKQKLKYKRKLPKANFGLDPRSLDNMNKAGANPEEESGGTMDAAGKGIGIASSVLQGVSSFMPQDNMDGIGVSHKGSSIAKGVSGGLKTAAAATQSIPILSGALGIGSALTDMVTGWVDKIREKDPTKVSRLARKEYEDSYSNVGYSFGTPAAKNGMVLNPTPQPKNKLDFDMERPLPPDLSYERDVNKFDYNFIKNNVPKELQEYQQGLPLPNNYRIYKTPKGYYNVYDEKNINIGYSQDGKNYIKGEPQFKNGGEPQKNIENLSYEDILTLNSLANKENLSKAKAATAVYKQNGLDEYINSFDDYLKAYSKSKLGSVYDEYKNVGKDTLDNYITDEVKGFSPNFIDRLQQNVNQSKRYLPQPTIKKGGQIEEFKLGGAPQPIYTSDKNDPRLKNYNDSLSLYKKTKDIENPKYYEDGYPSWYTWKGSRREAEKFMRKNNIDLDYESYRTGKFPGKIQPTKIGYFGEGIDYPIYKKPVQPVIYKEREQPRNIEKLEAVGTTKMAINNPEVNLNKKETSSGKYTVNTQNNSYSIPNKALFDIIVKKGMPKKSWESNGSGGATFDMSDETFFNNIGEYKKTFELGGDPRHLADIEAEKGEALQRGNKVIAIGGNTHENGGTPLKVQPNDKYIYSDTLGLDSDGKISINPKTVTQTFARLAKRTENKYKGKSDDLSLKTKDLELKMLTSKAEEARVLKEQTDEMKIMKKYKARYGADLKKFSNSGYPQFGVRPIGKTPSEEDDILTIQKRMIQNNPNALPKFGADGIWGDESKKEFENYSANIKSMVPAPVTGINNNTGLTPLFNGNLPSGPTSGMYDYDKVNEDDSQFYSKLSNFWKEQLKEVPKPQPKNGLFQNLSQGDKIQLAGMIPAVGYNLQMGLRKSEVEQAKKNPYESNILNMMANRKFDMQPYLNEANLANNVAREDIGNNSTSVGGKMANLQKLFANQSNALGDITTKGQEMNNQYRAEEANTKNIIGEANRAESIRAAGINDQNKARKQQFLAKAFEQMGQGIATTGQSANQSLTNKLLIKSLSEISPDFDVKNMKDLQVGDDGYIVFKGVKTEFKMSDEGKIVMAGGTPNTANAAKSQYAPKDFTMKAFANFTKTKTTK